MLVFDDYKMVMRRGIILSYLKLQMLLSDDVERTGGIVEHEVEGRDGEKRKEKR